MDLGNTNLRYIHPDKPTYYSLDQTTKILNFFFISSFLDKSDT